VIYYVIKYIDLLSVILFSTCNHTLILSSHIMYHGYWLTFTRSENKIVLVAVLPQICPFSSAWYV